MEKKFLISLIIVLAVVFFYSLIHLRSQNRQKVIQVNQNLKAPELKFTIIEGWTLQDISKEADYDEKRTDQPHLALPQEFLAVAAAFDLNGYPVLASKPKNASLEGFLFPDTYFIPANVKSASSSAAIIKKALDNFSKKITAQMQARAQAEHLSIFEVVTLASIVEKETGRNAVTDQQKQAMGKEREIVAGIFFNRLKAGIALQSDATINYITH